MSGQKRGTKAQILNNISKAECDSMNKTIAKLDIRFYMYHLDNWDDTLFRDVILRNSAVRTASWTSGQA